MKRFIIVLVAIFSFGVSTPSDAASKSDESDRPVLTGKRAPVDGRGLGAAEVAELKSQLSKTEQKIKVTTAETKQVRDTEFLPDLYFSLADLHLQKSRLMYLIKINQNGKVPINELDFTAEKRPKNEAIDIYQKIYAFFPKSKLRDRALFLKALELRDLNQADAMIKSFAQLNQEFPDSTYLREANIILGDYFLEEKKDIDGALEAFRRVISKDLSAYTPLAHYRVGWCFINQQKYSEAVTAFEEAIRTQALVSSADLSETYRKTDIKREAILSLAVPYVEIYGDYIASLRAAEKTEKVAGTTAAQPKALPAKVSAWVRPNQSTSKLPPPSATSQLAEKASSRVPTPTLKTVLHPVDYFRKTADSHLTYRRVLSRVGKRLALKDLWSEVADVWSEVLIANTDPDLKFEAIQRWNDAIKKSPAKAGNLALVEHAVLTAQNIRASKVNDSGRPTAKAQSQLKFLELVTRDIATRVQQSARDQQGTEGFKTAARAYELYQIGFPQHVAAEKMLINKSESLYRAEDWVRAGMTFEQLARTAKVKKKKNEFNESAIQSYVNALKKIDTLSALDVLRSRRAIREVGTGWIQSHMRHPAAASTAYNIAQSWYEDRHLPQAIQAFTFFVKNFPRDERVRDAIFMVINAYSQLDDFKGLVSAAKSLERTSGLSAEDRTAIRDASRRAQLKDLQLAAGNFGSKQYAENLMSMASKYKDSSMGATALYEAFTSLRSKRDPELYDVGEALLEKYSESTYSKEVVSSMAQTALMTADFERAARYLARFAERYPKEKESVEWKKSAAQIYEWLGDYRRSKNIAMTLGDASAVARADEMLADWRQLEVSGARLSGAAGDYLVGLALWRQGRQAEALPKLKAVSQNGDLDQSAHARFLLAQRALEAFRSIQMRDASDQGALLGKIKSFQALSQELNSIVKVGAGRWTIASLYLLGQANFELGRFIGESPLPKGLSQQEVKIYKTELDKQAKQYRDAATATFSQCLVTAERFEVFTRYVQGCRDRGRTIVKDEADAVVASNQQSFKPPSAARAIRLKLYDKPRDVGVLHQLAEAYIADGQYWVATAIYNRVLEIDDKNSAAIAGIGLCRWYLNDLDRAAEQFKRAMKLNSSEPVAVWNLVGLYNEFGFKGKIKQLASKRSPGTKPKLLHPMAKKAI